MAHVQVTVHCKLQTADILIHLFAPLSLDSVYSASSLNLKSALASLTGTTLAVSSMLAGRDHRFAEQNDSELTWKLTGRLSQLSIFFVSSLVSLASPQLINKPEDVKVQQGASVRLQCSTAGSPEPTLIYLRQLDFEAIQMLNVAPSSLPAILNQLTAAATHHQQKAALDQQTVLFAGHDYSRMHVDAEGDLLLKSAKKDDEGRELR